MIKTLQQRLVFFLLFPAALLLFCTGALGFLYARKSMLDQWREAAIVKLERAAHYIDMRVTEPSVWVDLFYKADKQPSSYSVDRWLLGPLRELDGVSEVNLDWKDDELEKMGMPGMGMHMEGRGMMHFHHAKIAQVTSPKYDAQSGKPTVTLVFDLEDENGRILGKLRIRMRFEVLMRDIHSLGWWQSDAAILVDASGRYLARTKAVTDGRTRLGETNDPLELAILAQMKDRPYGTLLGPGHPPERVAGFYKIKHAPWTIILFAPGEKILAPIVKFGFYYAIGGILCIGIILLLIRFVGGKMVHIIGNVSKAAQQVARGHYGEALPIKTRDEMGQLIDSFNTMVEGLRERDFISNTFGRYVDQEIANELMRHPEARRLGGVKREVAILMSDLREFTPLSETLSPDVTIRMLNRYFSRIIESIQKHQGIIVDFFGDALLVFFDPLEGPVSPSIHRAIRCAFEMQRIMDIFNAENRAEGLPELKMGIGLNAGEVVVGNIGSETRAKYGIVGSAVNATERIQSKAEGGEVVISEPVYRLAQDQLVVKRSFETQLKGIQESMTLYVVEGIENRS